MRHADLLSVIRLALSILPTLGKSSAATSGSYRDVIDTVDLLQVGLSLTKDHLDHLDHSAFTHAGQTEKDHSVLKATETIEDCPPLYPQCGQLKQICEDYSKNLLRLGTARPGDTTELLIDLTNALGPLAAKDRVQLLVMALFEQGAYTDDLGYIAERASPEEDTESTLLEMALSDDGIYVEVFKPIMKIRTSDLQSQYAVKSGLGSTLIARLPRLSCAGSRTGEDRIIVEVTELLQAGFFVVQTESLGYSATVVDAKEFPKNFDITVDYGPAFPLLRIGYTVVLLPDRPMKPRSNDDRLLYFDTQFLNKGSHKSRPFEVQKLSETVDWRFYDLAIQHRCLAWTNYPVLCRPIGPEAMAALLPESRIKYRNEWVEQVKETIMQHSEASYDCMTMSHFEFIPTKTMQDSSKERDWDVERSVHFDRATESSESHNAGRSSSLVWSEDVEPLAKLVARVFAGFFRLGTDCEDWPKDFDLADARFNTISWDLAPSTFSMGIAKAPLGKSCAHGFISATWVTNFFLLSVKDPFITFTFLTFPHHEIKPLRGKHELS